MDDSTNHEQIQDVVANVPHFLDHKQWRDLQELYMETVETDWTSLFGGKALNQRGAVLIEAWRTLLTPIVTQHLLGPIVVQIDGNSATARCHVRGYHYAKGAVGGDEWMVAGHYAIRLSKGETKWKIASMKLETFYQSGNTKLLEVAGGK